MKTKPMHLTALLLLMSSVVPVDGHVATGRLTEAMAPASATSVAATQATAHVVTVLVPTLEDLSALAMVVRRPDHPGNLILVTAETTPREFLRALRALNRSRRDVGEEPRDELRASIPGGARRPVFDDRGLASAAAHLARVKAAPPRAIEGLGSYPALTTALPALQR